MGNPPAFIEALLAAARATLGWRETSPNDAPFLVAWRALLSIKKPCAWCVIAIYAWFQAAAEATGEANPCPRTAGSQTFAALIPEEQRHREPLPGDVAVFRHLHDGRPTGKGHVELVEYNLVTKPGYCHSIGGNSNADGGREGVEVAEHDWSWAIGRRGDLELMFFARLAG